MSELIERALQTSTDTKAVIAGPDAIARVAELFRSTFGDRPALVVGDERTMSVAGNAVVDALASGGVRVLEPYVFPGDPELYAKYENCELLRDALRDVDAVPVAVGAGTLNDVVKRAAGELGRPYLVVATAASMDGYTAFGSSIAVGGYKQTLDCPAPAGCVADWTVLAAAPAVMTASGYGDLLGKVPAGADWIVADAVGTEALDDYVWELVQGPLRASLSRPEALAAGDPAAIGELAEGLVMSGLAMQAHASSRPASGAEHQFAHLWEMEGPPSSPAGCRTASRWRSAASRWRPCTNGCCSGTCPSWTWTPRSPRTPTPPSWRHGSVPFTSHTWSTRSSLRRWPSTSRPNSCGNGSSW